MGRISAGELLARSSMSRSFEIFTKGPTSTSPTFPSFARNQEAIKRECPRSSTSMRAAFAVEYETVATITLPPLVPSDIGMVSPRVQAFFGPEPVWPLHD